MSCCCNSLYTGLPCCCPPYTTTTTTLAPCEDAIVCDAAYVTDCVIYNGEVVELDCLTINPGDDYTQILEAIISNLVPCTTTTSTTTTTTICQRPSDLLEFNFNNAIICSGFTTEFTASELLACQALYDYFNTSGCNIMNGFTVETSGIGIGETVYYGTTTDCTYPEDGWYVWLGAPLGDENVVIHLVNGIIESITNCN